MQWVFGYHFRVRRRRGRAGGRSLESSDLISASSQRSICGMLSITRVRPSASSIISPRFSNARYSPFAFDPSFSIARQARRTSDASICPFRFVFFATGISQGLHTLATLATPQKILSLVSARVCGAIWAYLCLSLLQCMLRYALLSPPHASKRNEQQVYPVVCVKSESILSVQGTMRLCEVSRRTVENWFDQGLERIWLGRRVYTSREALDRFKRTDRPVEQDESVSQADRELDALGV